MIDFTNKVILVTGGTQGIGRAIAQAFQDCGGTVHITGTRPSVSSYEGDLERFSYHQLLADEDASRAALVEELPEIDVLINNVGGGDPKEFETETFIAVLQKNLVSAMDLSTRYKSALSTRRGSIVNVGSVASFAGIKDRPAYSAAKAGLLGLTRSLADRWAKEGIRVNLVAPGFVRTKLSTRLRVDEDYEKRIVAAIPMKRWAEPEEISGPVLFLASGAASYVTGTSLVVDGGVLIR